MSDEARARVEKAFREFIKGYDPSQLTPEQQLGAFKAALLDRADHLCGNCGSDHKVAAHLVVPQAAGGQLVPENGFTLCRACEMATSALALTETAGGGPKRPVNFWVSQRMFSRVKEMNGFGSVGTLVRFLMGQYLKAPEAFDDLDKHVEEGSDVKINVWVDPEQYALFRPAVTEQGLSVTNALKALLCLYETESVPLIEARRALETDQ